MSSPDHLLNFLTVWARRHGAPFVDLSEKNLSKIVLRPDDAQQGATHLQNDPLWQVIDYSQLPDRICLTVRQVSLDDSSSPIMLELLHDLSLYGLPYLTIDAVLLRATGQANGALQPDPTDAGLIHVFEALHHSPKTSPTLLSYLHTIQGDGGTGLRTTLTLLFGQRNMNRLAILQDQLSFDKLAPALRRNYCLLHLQRHGIMALAMLTRYLAMLGWKKLDRAFERLLLDLTNRAAPRHSQTKTSSR